MAMDGTPNQPTQPDQSEPCFRLIARWCALSRLGSRRLRTAAGSAAQLDALWHDEGCPELSAQNHSALERWLGDNRRVVFRWSQEFPSTLRQIPDPPVALFVSGRLAALAQPRVAMVGSRAATHSGMAVARGLAAQLSDAGVLVVSGLAQGIDYAAHTGALALNHPTAAIPGSGLQNLYPRTHQGLARQILSAGGVLLSEYAPWVAPHKSSFPARNRLISGLAAGVVVVQAAHKSGSLITARLAAEQGREVMAVPGAPGSPVSAGCNALLRDGAALIETADDIFAALGWETPASSNQRPDQATDQISALGATDPTARQLLAAIDSVPLTLEALIQFSGLEVHEAERGLLSLQLEGLVQATAQGYIRASH